MVVPAWMSAPSVRLGCTPLRYTAGERVWSPPLSPGPQGAALVRGLDCRVLDLVEGFLGGRDAAESRVSIGTVFFIWNGGLFTTPATSVENRNPFLPAS